MRVALVTREYPPEVYGGAGVHVDYLARELGGRLADVTVHCFGADRVAPDVRAYRPPRELAGANAALATLGTDLEIADALGGADVVHTHTWYANFAGHLGKLLYGIPHVVTAHSLEPLRPWKAEQLGGGYALSCFVERTAFAAADAVVAVSAGMREDVLNAYPAIEPWRVHVIHNGIDTEEYQPVHDPDLVRSHGVDPDRPSVVFVGRITRQKGVDHLLAAARDVDKSAQLVLCAGAADTVALREEVVARVAELSVAHHVVWIEEMLPKRTVMALLTVATVFVCPSVYEPMGIVNLEAMACETAVVASAVGGIPEVVDDGRTGLLVAYDPRDPDGFERGLAEQVNRLLAEPDLAREMGAAGRRRAVEQFSWATVAEQTLELYAALPR